MSLSITIDHLLIAAPDLELGRDYAESLFGVRPVEGGRHPGQGTRNALLGLANDVYVEIIAPDPAQSADLPLARYLAGRHRAALAWWCARCGDLETLRQSLDEAGIEPGSIDRWSRERPDGSTLGWRLLIPDAAMLGAALPFFIDWDDIAEHPSRHVPSAGRLRTLDIVHPDADRLQAFTGRDVNVTRGEQAGMTVEIEAAAGTVVLRSPTSLPPAMGRIIARG